MVVMLHKVVATLEVAVDVIVVVVDVTVVVVDVMVVVRVNNHSTRHLALTEPRHSIPNQRIGQRTA